MKKMKKIKVVIITLAVITLSFITESYLYTKEKVYELGKDLGADNFWRNNFYDSSDEYSNPDLNLGTLLSINFRRLDEFIIRDEDYNIKNNNYAVENVSLNINKYNDFDIDIDDNFYLEDDLKKIEEITGKNDEDLDEYEKLFDMTFNVLNIKSSVISLDIIG